MIRVCSQTGHHSGITHLLPRKNDRTRKPSVMLSVSDSPDPALEHARWCSPVIFVAATLALPSLGAGSCALPNWRRSPAGKTTRHADCLACIQT